MDIYIFILLVALGYFVGTQVEARHFRSLAEREEKFKSLPSIALKTPLPLPGELVDAKLVSGSVVLSIDYFKKILASLRNLFGGNVGAYETLVDRARREAILRMKEKCPEATQIINIRIETSSISKNAQDSVGSIEVLAYGTALTHKNADGF